MFLISINVNYWELDRKDGLVKLLCGVIHSQQIKRNIVFLCLRILDQ